MARKAKRVDSKQSTGTRRQAELLASSVCPHGKEAVRTQLLEGGKYEHQARLYGKNSCTGCIETLAARKRTKQVVLQEITVKGLLEVLLG